MQILDFRKKNRAEEFIVEIVLHWTLRNIIIGEEKEGTANIRIGTIYPMNI